MSKSSKAVLLSVLVFPGAGHLFLKKYLAGAVLAGVSFASLYYMISNTVDRAFEISDKILSGVSLDVTSMTEMASQQSASTDSTLLNITTTALTICWVIGIVDSYRTGRLQDKKDKKS